MKGETVSTPLDKDGTTHILVKAHLTTFFYRYGRYLEVSDVTLLPTHTTN